MLQAVDAYVTKMRDAAVAEPAVACFRTYYEGLRRGAIETHISEDDIGPPSEAAMPVFDHLAPEAPDGLAHTVMIKLNGGLGTSMGLSQAKSLLRIRPGTTFLDIIARQALANGVCLILMDSYATHGDTLSHLARYPGLVHDGLPLDFLQNQFPRIRIDSGMPLDFGDDRDWNPPGHGDIYLALQNGELLQRLIAAGYRYAFVSNSDNLGASPDARIPAYMDSRGVPFLMEVCRRGTMDSKGGHLACREADGRLVLRETAQRPPNGVDRFEDIDIYRWFNTNNLWVDLHALQEHLNDNHGMLDLPLIRNPKTVNGVDVIQFETAMGAAIEVFEGAEAMIVPRSRFAPVKKTNDLLVLRSDVYRFEEKTGAISSAHCKHIPTVELDPEHYRTVGQLDQHTPGDVPSLVRCASVQVEGSVTFASGVVLDGDVVLRAATPTTLTAGTYSGRIDL